MPELFSFQENNKFFIKFFLLDASLNLNQWGVTENSLKANLDTFIGKPFVLKEDADHPEARTGDELLDVQEGFRVGDIFTVGMDKQNHKAFGLAEITDQDAIERIKSGEINFVSPSIIFNPDDSHFLMDGSRVIDKWEAAHVAGVKDPAFGMYKAQIKGQCSGDQATCEKDLAMVQASKKHKILTFHSANQTIMVAASTCVEECIRGKADRGKEIDDQAVAICFSECGESKEGILKKDKKPYEANIDPQSLENITKIDLLKKKGQTVNPPAKPNKKCNIDPNLACTEENASLKHTTKKGKTMTEHDKKDEESNIEEEERKEGEEHEEKKDAEEHEDEEKKEEGNQEEDEDKLKKGETHDKDKMDARIRDLEVKLANKDKEPFVDQIVKARVAMGQIKEMGSAKTKGELYPLSLSMLKTMAADYSKMSTLQNSPKLPYTTLYASRDNRDGGYDMDKLLQKVKDY